jgi:hypothetical protein
MDVGTDSRGPNFCVVGVGESRSVSSDLARRLLNHNRTERRLAGWAGLVCRWAGQQAISREQQR